MTTLDPAGPQIDRALAHAAARGDQDAVEALFHRHHQAVFACCARLTGDREAAADISQEVFLRMLREVASFRGEALFSTWLLRIARNAAIDWRRKNATRERGEMLMANEGLAHTDDEPKRLGRVDLLERALGRLRSESREALVLARFHDLPHKQLAVVLNCSEAAARVRVHRAMRELREIILALEGVTP
jgi:RNA polymerase sigma-70 factor (ECF subfamily)